MAYIDRNTDGNIICIFATQQYDDQEFVDGDVELYVAPPTIAQDIAALEATVTPRRIREALLGDTTFVDSVNAQIIQLRTLLPQNE